jgi:hypothetical protein
MFYRGQELVCIDWGPWTDGYTGERVTEPNPIKDEIYHYAGAHLCPLTGDDFIFLDEFGGQSGPAFEACSFRPLIKVEDFMTVDAPAPKETVDA